MGKLSLKKAEASYSEAVEMVRERIGEALENGKLGQYLEQFDVEVYIKLVDSFLDVMYHYFSDFTEQPAPVHNFFKKFLQDDEKKEWLEELLIVKTLPLRDSCARFALLLLMLLKKHAEIALQQNPPDKRYALTIEVPTHTFYPPYGGQVMGFIPALMTTCKSGFLWLLLKEVTEFRSTFPYLKYLPDAQSSHRCTTHELLFDQVFSIDNPIWSGILPANGEGCKCRLEPLKSSEINGADELTEFQPDSDRNSFKPFLDFNCVEDKTLFFWLKVNPIEGAVLYYIKDLSKKRGPISINL